MCCRDRKIMKKFIFLVGILDALCWGREYSTADHGDRNRRYKGREYYSDAYSPHESMHSKWCTAEEAISALRGHIKREHSLEKAELMKDECIAEHFGDILERVESSSHPYRRAEGKERREHSRYNSYSTETQEGKTEHRPPRKIYCVPPFQRDSNGDCRSTRRKKHGAYDPPYDEYSDGVVYSLREERNRDHSRNDFNGNENEHGRNDFNREKNEHGRNDFNGNSHPSHSKNDSSGEDGLGSPLPMYCMLPSGKIVPYIISYGPPDEKKRRIYINLPNDSSDAYGGRGEFNPLKRLSVKDTILSSPLTNGDLSGLISKIEQLSTFTKIVHIYINDTPIIQVGREHLLHPMCTEGYLCLSGYKCKNTPLGECVAESRCVSPTVDNFVRSIPKNTSDKNVSITVYNAHTREFAVEDISLDESREPHTNMLEYTSTEAPLLERSPVCEETVRIIKDAILNSKYGYNNRRYNHTSYIVESNNTRGFIIFLLLKQILEDDDQGKIDSQTKQQMTSIYMDTFKNEIGEDLVGSVIAQDISQIVEVMNRERKNKPHSTGRSWPDSRRDVHGTPTYEEEYGLNGNRNTYQGRHHAR